jgi:hypothetical protein
MPSDCILEDPGMSLIDDLRQQRQIVSTETLGVLPLVSVFVESRHGHIVTRSHTCLVLPDGDLYGPHSELVNRLLFRLWHLTTPCQKRYRSHTLYPDKGDGAMNQSSSPGPRQDYERTA